MPDRMLLTILLVIAYLAAVPYTYRWGIRRYNRFAWHSSSRYYCFGEPCRDCKICAGMHALLWPVFLAWLWPDDGEEADRLMTADRIARTLIDRGMSEIGAQELGGQLYEDRVTSESVADYVLWVADPAFAAALGIEEPQKLRGYRLYLANVHHTPTSP